MALFILPRRVPHSPLHPHTASHVTLPDPWLLGEAKEPPSHPGPQAKESETGDRERKRERDREMGCRWSWGAGWKRGGSSRKI